MKHNEQGWQYTNLEISKALKEAGVEQKSMRFWNFNDRVPEQGWYLDDENLAYPPKNTISAFSPAELGRILPHEKECFPLMITKFEKDYVVAYLDAGECGGHYWHNDWMAEMTGDTMANAMGKMLEYLTKEKLI